MQFVLRGPGRSVPCPWTGAERPSPSRGALKTGRCSELDAEKEEEEKIPPLSRMQDFLLSLIHDHFDSNSNFMFMPVPSSSFKLSHKVLEFC